MTDRATALIPTTLKTDARLNEMFTRCLPQLRRAAARLLSNRQDSEDALQEGLLSGVRHASKFEGRSKFSTWMHTIVVNSARSTLRRRRRQPMMTSLDEPHPENPTVTLADVLCDHGVGLEEHYRRVERQRILADIVQHLPPAHRSIICLCDLEGLCMREVARRLDLSISAAKTRHLRASRFLLRLAKAARERHVPVVQVIEEHAAAQRRFPEPAPRTLSPKRPGMFLCENSQKVHFRRNAQSGSD